jgi:hypothetical protein
MSATTAIADRMNGEFISDFVELCACRRIDPEKFLKVLNAQDWKAAKVDSVQRPANERFMRKLSRLLTKLDGDLTWKQLTRMVEAAAK